MKDKQDPVYRYNYEPRLASYHHQVGREGRREGGSTKPLSRTVSSPLPPSFPPSLPPSPQTDTLLLGAAAEPLAAVYAANKAGDYEKVAREGGREGGICCVFRIRLLSDVRLPSLPPFLSSDRGREPLHRHLQGCGGHVLRATHHPSLLPSLPPFLPPSLQLTTPPSLPPSLPPLPQIPAVGRFIITYKDAVMSYEQLEPLQILDLLGLFGREGGREGGRKGGREGKLSVS